MSCRAVGLRAGALLFLSGFLAGLPAADTSLVDYPFLGVTHIFRTGSAPNFPRNVKMHIIKIDLTAPSLFFKLTPPGGARDVSRLTTLGYLTQQGAQIAINSHFFLPFPSTDLNADVIGFGVANGIVFSPFELPSQNYAIERDAPAINIDANNQASIVTRAPGFSDGTCFLCAANDGLHVQEPVALWNAFAGSAQIITNGVKTIPCYVDATHPDCKLVGPGPANYSNSNSWYSLTNARVSIGLSQDNKTLFLFTVDNANGSSGMSVPEVADLLLNDYGVYNALNMDGGGSTTLAMENPTTHVRSLVNSSSDSAAGRIVASSLAVFAAPNPTVTHTVNTSPAGPAFSIDGTGFTSSANPEWTYGSTHTIATTSPQTVSGTRYDFTNWSDSGAISHAVSGATTSQVYTANFNVSYQLSTSVSPAGAGTVTPPSGNFHAPGTPVGLLATAKSGYAFNSWTGSVANPAAASTSITMSAPQLVRANFTALPVLSGSITGKTGAYSARVNTTSLTNSGPGVANSARIDSFRLTQTAGASCGPVVRIALPVIVGNINPAKSASGNITVNYTGCSSASRFTVAFTFSANAGGVTGSKTLYNQTR